MGDNVGPNLDGVSGDGDQDRGRALGKENRPHVYSGFNVSDIDISQVNQRVSCCPDDVALQPENVRPCFLMPKAFRPNLRTP
jgi:hypothetical protein